jgi:spore coat protein U-like protein
MRRCPRRAIVVAGLALVPCVVPTGLVADTDTANLSVTATVVANCSIDTTTVAFGNYDPAVAHASSPLDGTGTVTITCTKGTTSTVGLDVGSNASGSTRRMSNGSDFLSYELYQNGGRTVVWGNSGGDLHAPGAAPSSAPRAITVYGRVTGGQDVGVGSYADTVVATVTF